MPLEKECKLEPQIFIIMFKFLVLFSSKPLLNEKKKLVRKKYKENIVLEWMRHGLVNSLRRVHIALREITVFCLLNFKRDVINVPLDFIFVLCNEISVYWL